MRNAGATGEVRSPRWPNGAVTGFVPVLPVRPLRRRAWRDYSPNLSILVGEGNESKRDSLSSGERNG